MITPGCTNCYAMRMAARLDAMGVPKYEGLTRKSGDRYVWTGKVRLDEASLDAPLKWRKPRKIFVNSMSDLFHADVPTGYRARLGGHGKDAPPHLPNPHKASRPDARSSYCTRFTGLPHVWLGTSVEDSAVISRFDDLRATPAIIRFVSFEPLIGSVANADLTDLHWAIIGGNLGPAPAQ